MAETKTENGVAFPARAFAFVPDAEKPSTWKLRVWEDLEKKVTVRQLGRAAAAFSPGGFRGQRVQIPEDAGLRLQRLQESQLPRLSDDVLVPIDNQNRPMGLAPRREFPLGLIQREQGFAEGGILRHHRVLTQRQHDILHAF